MSLPDILSQLCAVGGLLILLVLLFRVKKRLKELLARKRRKGAGTCPKNT